MGASMKSLGLLASFSHFLLQMGSVESKGVGFRQRDKVGPQQIYLRDS